MRVLRCLLWLLPAAFRREYGRELLQTCQDQWRAARRASSLRGRCRFWLRQWLAALRAGVRLRRGRGILGGADKRRLDKEDGMHGLWTDVRHSLRSLAARPGFTAVAVLTLGLGVGATTAMFSAVQSVLLRALPYRDAGDIVVLRQIDSRDGSLADGVSAANLHHVSASAETLLAASGAEAHGLRLMEDGRAYSLRSWLVSEGFFEAMGGEVALGRTFLPREFLPGGEKVVLLGHRTWQSRFGGEAGIVGRQLTLDGAAYTVVGVLAADFEYPEAAEIWGPRPPQPWDDDRRAFATLDAVARLAPGATAAQAQAELDRLASDLTAAYPGANADLGLRAVPLRQHLLGDVETPLLLLLGAVGLVLLIAAANVAGLQVARGAGRAREYALRGALGASSRRLLRLAAVDSLFLAGAGGLLGIGLAVAGIDLIRLLGPDHVPRLAELRIDASVLAFALLAALGSASVAGLAPALQAARMDPQRALADGTRGTTRGARAGGLRDRLVVAEIALALILTIGAGLLVRSFDRLLGNELGFDPADRLAVQAWAYDDDHRPRLDFFQRSQAEIAALPGVQAVGLTTDLPLADDRSILSRQRTVRFSIDDRPAARRGEEPVAVAASIDGVYADAMGIALRAGRHFSSLDHPRSPAVAMINEAFARRHFAGRDPVGRRLTLRQGEDLAVEIVGVLADVRPQGFASVPRPAIYRPLSQAPSNGLTFVVKTAADPAAQATAVQHAMWTADPSQAIWAARPMSDLLSDRIRQRRFNTVLLVLFAGLALSLAAVGVYGLMSFSVAQRTGELGIRRALGGSSRDILAMILRRGWRLALAGVGLGLLGALALTRLLRGMLFGVEPFDPLTFAALSALVTGVALLAALLPARRATRVDPMAALRTDS